VRADACRWALLAALAGAVPAGAGQAAATTALDVEPLVAALDTLRREGDVPAMAVVILDQGHPAVITGLGNAGPDTPFRWGSITKSFTALAALALVADGRITLDAPVRPALGADYFDNPWAATDPVRLGHLLALSAGFSDLSRDEWDDNTPVPLWTALSRYAAERVVRWPPGLQHSYSNAPPGLTSAVIERLTGEPFDRYLADRVFTPLGMSGASLSPVAGLPGGFQADGRTEIPYWHMTYPAFGALNASARDMSRFLTALLNDGQVPAAAGLPSDLIRRFIRPGGTLAAAAGLEVGYGYGIYGRVRNGHVFLGHGGDADGYRARYGALIGHHRGYALVIDTDNPRLLGQMERLVEAALTADLPAHPAPSAGAGATRPAQLTSYAGTYYPSSSRFGPRTRAATGAQRAEVTLDGDGLVFRRGSVATALRPAGEGRFYRPGDPAITVVFLRYGADVYLQGELGNFVNLSTGPCPDFLGACD